jgi:thymidylate synthase (FAD)
MSDVIEDFRENRVDLFGDNIGGVSLIQHMGDDLTPVNAARASLDKLSTEYGDSEARLSNFLIRSGHTSTSEHNLVTFWIKVPMFVARQHMRHRTFSFNEISRRYTSEKLEFYYPSEMRKQDTKNRQASLNETFDPPMNLYPQMLESRSASEAIRYHTQISVELYEDMIQKGVAREQARMILPQNIYTTYWCTGSLHNWVNSFISKRDHIDAQWEMRLLAREISRQIEGLWPHAHANFVKHGKIPDLKEVI